MKKEIRVGVGVIVVKGDKILTGIRKGSHGAGCRAFPGGHVEFKDESLTHASSRELKEECGIIVSHKLIQGGYDLFTTFDTLSEDGDKKYITIYMVADYISGGYWIDENTLLGLESDKCERWEFLTLEEVAELLSSEKERIWIPIHRIEQQREEIFK